MPRSTSSSLPSFLLLFLLSFNILVNGAYGLISVPLPSVVVTMRSSSDTNVSSLLTNTLRQSNAYFNNYLASYYNVTGDSFGFSHVIVSVKSYGVAPTTKARTRFQAQAYIKGFVYYLRTGASANQVTTLITYALNDKNRVIFIDRFLKTSGDPFLQKLTAMEVAINNVLDGTLSFQ